MLVVGAEVDRYVVEALLGSGGMAVVYRVRHRTLHTAHALKVLTNTVPQVRDRLVVEGRIQAGLRHPNLVAVTDVLDVAGAPALLMDYVEGPALDGWITRRGPLPIAEVEAIFGGVLAGVAAAHARGLVHRDLKPGNVLLEVSGPRPVARVSDFGIAKVLAEDGAPMGRTRTGMMMGSPPYMSPEQFDDARGVDARADVFALGCVLYEMLTGAAAFEHPSMFSTFAAIKEGRWTRAEVLRGDVPVAWRAALEGCLEPDRDRRIPDCAQLAAVLAGEAWPPHGVPAPRVSPTQVSPTPVAPQVSPTPVAPSAPKPLHVPAPPPARRTVVDAGLPTASPAAASPAAASPAAAPRAAASPAAAPPAAAPQPPRPVEATAAPTPDAPTPAPDAPAPDAPAQVGRVAWVGLGLVVAFWIGGAIWVAMTPDAPDAAAASAKQGATRGTTTGAADAQGASTGAAASAGHRTPEQVRALIPKDGAEKPLTIAQLKAGLDKKAGWKAVDRGEYAAARRAFEKAVKSAPGAEALYGRGFANEKLGDDAAAARDYCAALALEEANGALRDELGARALGLGGPCP